MPTSWRELETGVAKVTDSVESPEWGIGRRSRSSSPCWRSVANTGERERLLSALCGSSVDAEGLMRLVGQLDDADPAWKGDRLYLKGQVLLGRTDAGPLLINGAAEASG